MLEQSFKKSDFGFGFVEVLLPSQHYYDHTIPGQD